jgi:S1-C subfamily serine protease
VRPLGVRAKLVLLSLTIAGGCAGAMGPPSRDEALRLITGATVSLRIERDPGARRAASGVAVAVDRRAARTWIVSARHAFDRADSGPVLVTRTGQGQPLVGRVVALSPDADLALLEVQATDIPVAVLKEAARLGDEVWVVAFPRGRRATLVSGVISQLAEENAVEGPAAMVDAPVSYGASGGGVFDPSTGDLVGIVEGYRTARVAVSGSPERTVDIPFPGETTVVSAAAIRRFLGTVDRVQRLLP